MLQRQGHAAEDQQHREPGHHVLEQMGALLPRGEQPEQQRQQQADEMEDHRRVFTHLAVIAVKIGLGIQQEVGDVHRDHQKQLALTAVDGAIRASQKQHQCRQHIEQGGEEDVEILDVGSRKPRQQQQQ